MRISWALCTGLAVLSSPAVALGVESFDLTLQVGEQHVLPATGVGSYSEGLPGVVDVRLTKNGQNFVVVGLRAGTTSLLFMMEDGRRLQYSIAVNDQISSPVSAEPSTAVPARDNIRLDFYFVQLSRDDRTQLGVAWPASIGGPAVSASFDMLGGRFTEATAVVTDQALPGLDLAQARGWAKLLRKAAIIAANGAEARFSGGGEVNIAVESALSVGVRQVSFGSDVRVKPRYDRDTGRLELTIHAEVSDLASDHGSGIPGRVTSNLDTVVNLELGQSLVLAGLSAHTESSSRSGLPALSQIPILGALFGSSRTFTEQSENVVFIVPSVVDVVSLDARERIDAALAAFRSYDGDLEAASPGLTDAPALRRPARRKVRP